MTGDVNTAIAALDAANAEDPRTVTVDGESWPAELLYARRMRAWLDRLYPDASDALRLAASAQHVRRWEIPRGDYPEGRDGYLRWRTHLKRHHAKVAAAILADAECDDATIRRVQTLVRKQGIKTDPETQALEDVIGVVFLDSYAADFVEKHDEAKVVRILAKTWAKMSETGREAALTLDLPPRVRTLVERAVSG
ncbi:protein of unknown function [Limimonas halophila]|uniref:DUF4202 domain-containing protein n=1 Tax=Limimonas halophila TaxID=1082479 RepID=A0A1G7TR79_9PROT|nr:DUF4202 domain-containing protein [Limimonas halophila]SDG37785.1 protein of unknown function [Limimonas halophila]